jgi:homoserine kinase type II
MELDPSLELKEILQHYSLGELAGQEKNERGYVNTSFAIETVLDGKPGRYFLRKYKRGIKEEEIQFEHSLICHLVAEKSPPVARLHLTRQGKTYLHRFEEEQDTEGVFYAIFDYLPGEDRFTWVSPHCSDEELSNAAAVLAQFHSAASRLQPHGRRAEPKIMDLLPVIAENTSATPQRSRNTVFDACLLENLPLLLGNIERTLAELSAEESAGMPQVIVHCDFHPGNLKYERGQVVGLFDFDWSKVDVRCFDVALALWYFCTEWEGSQDGELRVREVEVFLKAYQAALRNQPGIGPLSPLELKYLAPMISASNLYIYNWTIEDFYHKAVDPEEYLIYLRHSVSFAHWYESSRARLEEIIQAAV